MPGLIRIHNVQGTVLSQGIMIKFASEVGFVDNVSFTPSYWADAKGFQPPSASAISSWMKSNSVSGLDMAGLEGVSFTNMTFDSFQTGVKTSKTPRSDGAEAYDQFYNLTVKNAVIGVDLPYTYWDMGMLFAESSLSGSSYSIKNSSSNPVKLFNTQLSGPESGNIVKTTGSVSVKVPVTKRPGGQKKTLYNAANRYGADPSGKSNAAPAIQKALDAAKANGGGYVYLPGGIYRIDTPLTVPANTVLLGANEVIGNDAKIDYAGTVLFAYYGKGKSASDQAMITLSGQNAGVKGMRIYYPQNGVTKTGSGVNNKVTAYAYAIRGTASNVFCENLSFYATYCGIEMKNASDFLIKNMSGSFYKNGYGIVNCNGGTIENCHANNGMQGYGTAFSYLPDFKDWLTVGGNSDGDEMYKYLINGVGREMNNYIVYSGSTNQKLHNVFAYIPKNFLTATNSKITAVNIYGSRMGEENALITAGGGEIISVNNYLKLAQVAKLSNGAKAQIYNIKGQILPSGISENNIVR